MQGWTLDQGMHHSTIIEDSHSNEARELEQRQSKRVKFLVASHHEIQ